MASFFTFTELAQDAERRAQRKPLPPPPVFKIVPHDQGGFVIRQVTGGVVVPTWRHMKAAVAVAHLRRHIGACTIHVHGPDGRLYRTLEIA